MKALDTNVLVRFLVKDDPIQSQVVYELFKKAENAKHAFWISLPVVMETLWVLESVYEIQRNDVLTAFSELLLMPILIFEAQSAVQLFLSFARQNKHHLSDLLIGACASQSGCDHVLTFDKRASRFDYFRLLR